MSLTRRGKVSVAAAAVAAIAVALIGLVVVFPDKAPAFVRNAVARVGIVDPAPPPPPSCPLTGEPAPHGELPHRPALAIKVENYPDARPQAGLGDADIVYEEPVEGGITRFIVIYQCRGSRRVGPVRSGRTTDPNVLVQFGHPPFGYAGGVQLVERMVQHAGLPDVDYITAAQAYERDPSRAAPHNLYTTTAALYRAAKSHDGPPDPIFTYAADIAGKTRRASVVHLPYSWYSDVYWRWSRRRAAWLRSHGDEPHMLEGGEQVSAVNVVVQVVKVANSRILDHAGNPSPDVTLTGTGRAYVFRDGRMILGRWERPTLHDLTRFYGKDGSEIALAPGSTWVELLPSTLRVEVD